MSPTARRQLALEDGDGVLRRHAAVGHARAAPARALGDPRPRAGRPPRPRRRPSPRARRSRDAGAPRPARARACRRGPRSDGRPAGSGVSARKSSAAATLTGEALYVSSTSVAPELGLPTAMRWSAWLPAARAAPTSSMPTPSRSATAAAASACGTRWRPGVPLRSRSVAHGASQRELGSGQPVARDVGGADVGVRPKAERAAPAAAVTPRHRRHAWIVGVEDRKPVRRQGAAGARTSPRDRGRCCRPARDGWDARRARRRPRARAISASRAISPTVYMLISRTAASCVGAQPKQRHRQPGLGVQVALVSERREPRERTSATISLAIVLPVEPVIPTTRAACRATATRRPGPGGPGACPARRPGERRCRSAAAPRAARRARRRRQRGARRQRTHARPSARRRSATKIEPGVTWRESTEAPVDGG